MTERIELAGGAWVELNAGNLEISDVSGEVLRAIPVAHIAEANASDLASEVYLRLFTQEELVLPATSFKDADRIEGWARSGPRLQRRSTAQRRTLRDRARNHVIFGGLCSLLGFGVTAMSYSQAEPGGWYLVMLGPIIFGACDFVYGIGLFFTRPVG